MVRFDGELPHVGSMAIAVLVGDIPLRVVVDVRVASAACRVYVSRMSNLQPSGLE